MRSLVLAMALLCVVAARGNAVRSFSISKNGSTFLRDGKPFQVISGGFHYFRALAAEWPQRFDTIAASGVNTVETYVAWNFHCPDDPDTCDFTGDRDLFKYIQLAQERGLLLILRVGPYICAEWDFGGLPWWLLKGEDPMEVRTRNPAFIAAVQKWFNILLPKVVPYLYENGGPIVMVQVENEHGMSGLRDKVYLETIRDMMRAALGPNVIHFSVDGNGTDYLYQSAIPGVYQTVDFYNDEKDASRAWKVQHQFESLTGIKGPNMNSEYYVGWISYWGTKGIFARDPVKVMLNTMKMLKSSKSPVNMNMYQQFGGTNFGFWSGSNEVGFVPTSYDYGAPINQSGHPTPMFNALRGVFAVFVPNPSLKSSIPQPPPLAEYGTVTLTEYASLAGVENLKRIAKQVVQHASSQPPSMENVGLGYGYIAYQFSVNQKVHDINLRPLDYALVYMDDEYEGHIHSTSLTLTLANPRHISAITVVVENMGRMNYWWKHPSDVQKGLASAPDITCGEHEDNTENIEPSSYTIYTLPMTHDLISKANWRKIAEITPEKSVKPLPLQPGTFYRGLLNITGTLRGGTMLDMREFGKGFVFVNGFNLGRFWSEIGPQYSLYCPESILKAGTPNEVIVFEQSLSFSEKRRPPMVHFTSVNYDVFDVENTLNVSNIIGFFPDADDSEKNKCNCTLNQAALNTIRSKFSAIGSDNTMIASAFTSFVLLGFLLLKVSVFP
ncbi:Glycoside hydrolase 35 [Trypanosoma melophagium]|uniref:Glycoside hydrolase 35 n=1 Tax=Trypanosoma melophagium TaxID=715481 RepID=UPI003519E7E7|nr:Glycoside hydrolase 35 [Trypanosoma melophagium]